MTPVFQLDALERRLAKLDDLPQSCWRAALINNEGGPLERPALLAGWFQGWSRGDSADAAAAGAATAGSDAPGLPADVLSAFGPVFERLDLPSLCRGSPAVAEQLIRSFAWHVDQVARGCDTEPRGASLARVAGQFQDQWVGRAQSLHQVVRLFESIDGLNTNAHWSALQGLLQSQAWQAVLHSHGLMAQMPRLRELIRSMGRWRPTAEDLVGTSAPLDCPNDPPRTGREPVDSGLPEVPVEIEAIRRSGDLSQALVSELLWVSKRMNPERARRLRRLFAARLADQALLAFEHRSPWTEWRCLRLPTEAARPVEQDCPQREAGPLLVCVDTSASMAGAPEQVAKAIVLEVMRVAGVEKRLCQVYTFGASGEVCELELGCDLDGLQTLSQFIAGSFHGGTDVTDPMAKALDRLAGQAWADADLLLVSDGEFGPTRQTLEALEQARARFGLRVQGVLIGDRETLGLRRLCDRIFWVRDWRRYGPGSGHGDAPVHDSRLTSIYFPKASAEPD